MRVPAMGAPHKKKKSNPIVLMKAFTFELFS